MNVLSWLLVALVVAGVAFLSLWDETLDADASRWLQRPRPVVGAHDNGYFALMGMFAAERDAAHEVGRSRVQAYEISRVTTAGQTTAGFDDYPEDRRLTVDPAVDMLCQIEQTTCLPAFGAEVDTIRALAARHRTLLERYQALAGYSRFVTTAAPGLNEPRIPVLLLSSVARLQNALLAVEFEHGSRLRAVERLAQSIRFQRRLLAEADQVSLKMLCVHALALDMHLLAEMLDSPGYVHRHLPALDNQVVDLDAAERALGPAIEREFMEMADLLFGFPGAGDLGLDVQVPRWMTAVMYKPNATVNRMFVEYRSLHELAALAPARMRQAWEPVPHPPTPVLTHVLNPIGTVLSDVSGPDLRPYIARLNDAAGLIRLVRIKLNLRRDAILPAHVQALVDGLGPAGGSPYTSLPVSWDPSRQKLYFEGLGVRTDLTELGLPFILPISSP